MTDRPKPPEGYESWLDVVLDHKWYWTTPMGSDTISIKNHATAELAEKNKKLSLSLDDNQRYIDMIDRLRTQRDEQTTMANDYRGRLVGLRKELAEKDESLASLQRTHEDDVKVIDGLRGNMVVWASLCDALNTLCRENNVTECEFSGTSAKTAFHALYDKRSEKLSSYQHTHAQGVKVIDGLREEVRVFKEGRKVSNRIINNELDSLRDESAGKTIIIDAMAPELTRLREIAKVAGEFRCIFRNPNGQYASGDYILPDTVRGLCTRYDALKGESHEV